MRSLRAIAGVVVVGFASLAMTSVAGATTALHFYSVAQTSELLDASGQPITNPNAEPAVGDRFDSTDLDYVGTHAHHASRYSASDHLSCTFTSISGNSGTATCDGQIAIGSSMLLADNVQVNLGNNGISSVPLNAGTGVYKGAQGTVSSQGIGNTNNSNLTITLTKT